ncbi:MAG: sigma-70 family RNA polymerase sigma factor [Candidatus Omnitrophota bacterium]|nr:sigma-70 family RNA polymerase sigma factor [Candidatus Omnitrophota bacterium]
MSDLDFIQKCVANNPLAWKQFIDRYSRLIYSSIYNLLKISAVSKYDVSMPREIFQEILLSMVKDDFRKLRSFKGKNGCSLASWLRQVCINATIDYLRKINPTISLDQEDDDNRSLGQLIPDDAPSTKELVMKEEELNRLSECIKRLDTADQFFLSLYLEQALGLEEIRNLLRLSRSAVDMRKARIVERLKICFKKKGFEIEDS